jgi:hypothetical protein
MELRDERPVRGGVDLPEQSGCLRVEGTLSTHRALYPTAAGDLRHQAARIEMTALEIVAFVAIGLGAAISVANWMTLHFSRREKRHISAVPLVGALLLAYGLCCFAATRPFAWLAIIADYGTLALVLALPTLIGEAWATSRVNLVRTFVSRQSGRVIELRLFKRAIFTIEVTFDPPVPCNPHGALISSFGLTGSWRQEGTEIVLDGYVEDRILRLRPDEDRLISEETNYPEGNQFPYDSLTMLTFEVGKAGPSQA